MTDSIAIIRAGRYLELREAVRKFQANPITANKFEVFDLCTPDKWATVVEDNVCQV